MTNRIAALLAITALFSLCHGLPARAQSDPQSVFKTVRKQLDAGKPARAVRQAEKSIKRMKDSQKAFRTRVRVVRLVLNNYLRKGKGKSALEKELDTLLKTSKAQAKELAYLLTGRIHVFIDEYDAARNLLQTYLENYSPPSKKEVKKYAKEGEKLAEAARRHPRSRRRMIAREMLERLELVGDKVPAFQLATLEGKTLSTRDLRGNPAVLVFWRASSDEAARWMSILRTVYADYRDKGLTVVCLSVDRGRKTLKKFLQEHDLPWPQIFLGGRRRDICRRFGLRALYPASILVDEKGIVRGVDLKGTALARRLRQLTSQGTAAKKTSGAQL